MRFITTMAVLLIGAGQALAEAPMTLPLRWELSAPLVGPEQRGADSSRAEKDPTIVFDLGKWHIWATTKYPTYTGMEYLSFAKWDEAEKATRNEIKMHEKYACAPQVFYFRPHAKWYMIYQCAGYVDRGLKMQPVYSTSTNIADPASWTKPALMFADKDPAGVKAWIDFWVICDDARAHLFFTSNNGKMWHASAKIADFPNGFGEVNLALEGDIFEASHTYKLKGTSQYLTVIEAQGRDGRRYYKGYLADRLDGKWTGFGDTEAKPFAGAANVRPADGATLWTDNISHGELLRDSNDETLTVDPKNLQFLIQGCLNTEKQGKGYSQWPWRLGMLKLVTP